jgi:hypothetical protein
MKTDRGRCGKHLQKKNNILKKIIQISKFEKGYSNVKKLLL